MFHAFRIAQARDLAPFTPFQSQDFALDPTANSRTRHRSAASDETSPIGGVPERSLHSRRRDFQHVLITDQSGRVEPRLECTRRLGAIIDRHFRSIAPVDANVEQRPARRTTTPEFHEVESQRVNLLSNEVFERLMHIREIPPQEQKNAGEPSPTFPDRGLVAPRSKRNVRPQMWQVNRSGDAAPSNQQALGARSDHALRSCLPCLNDGR